MGTQLDARKWCVSETKKLISYLRKVINSWISELKQYEETMANEQSQNERGGTKSMRSYKIRTY